MANSELDDREAELSKKDRLINAWLAAGPEAMAKNIAEITDSSVAYASRIESQMEEGDISEDDVEAVRDEALVDEYADRLERLARQDEDTTGGENADATAEPDDDRAEPSGGSDQRQPSAREAQRQHQERQQEAARGQQSGQQPQQQSPQQQPPRQQQPAQPPQQGQQRQQQQQPPQQSREAFPTEGSVPVERLRELDRLLAAFEEEAQFELQHLPQPQAAEAVGKLFVAGKTRSLLREAVGEDRGEGGQ